MIPVKHLSQLCAVQGNARILINRIVTAIRIHKVYRLFSFLIPGTHDPFHRAVFVLQIIGIQRDRQILIREYPCMVSAAQTISPVDIIILRAEVQIDSCRFPVVSVFIRKIHDQCGVCVPVLQLFHSIRYSASVIRITARQLDFQCIVIIFPAILSRHIH